MSFQIALEFVLSLALHAARRSPISLLETIRFICSFIINNNAKLFTLHAYLFSRLSSSSMLDFRISSLRVYLSSWAGLNDLRLVLVHTQPTWWNDGVSTRFCSVLYCVGSAPQPLPSFHFSRPTIRRRSLSIANNFTPSYINITLNLKCLFAHYTYRSGRHFKRIARHDCQLLSASSVVASNTHTHKHTLFHHFADIDATQHRPTDRALTKCLLWLYVYTIYFPWRWALSLCVMLL